MATTHSTGTAAADDKARPSKRLKTSFTTVTSIDSTLSSRFSAVPAARSCLAATDLATGTSSSDWQSACLPADSSRSDNMSAASAARITAGTDSSPAIADVKSPSTLGDLETPPPLSSIGAQLNLSSNITTAEFAVPATESVASHIIDVSIGSVPPSTTSERGSSHPGMTSPSTEDINPRIQALPQELQDEILHLALLAMLPPKHKFSWSSKTREQHHILPSTVPEIVPYESSYSTDRTFVWQMNSFADHETCWHLRRAYCPCPFASQQVNLRWTEVYDDILEVNATIVDRHYKPSIALQINRKSRSTMSKIFYSDTVFLQINGGEAGTLWGTAMSMKWSKTVPREYREMTKVYYLMVYKQKEVSRSLGG